MRIPFWIVVVAMGLMTNALSQTVQARTYAAVVQDYRTGEVLHSRSADKRIYPASLTKMMTLYMLFEAIDSGRLSKTSALKVSRRAAGMPASKLGLKRGSTISVDDAIRALVVKSANDVAVVVAEALAKTEIQFAVKMTEKAQQLGMSRTTFKNASGLPNRRQKSTAKDMARLATKLLRDFSHHYHYFSLTSFRFAGKTYRSHNKLLKSYAGADGMKTGYIRASGFNLATSAKRNGNRLVAVVIGGRKSHTRDAQMVKLLDMGFKRMRDRGPVVALGPPMAKPTALGTSPTAQLVVAGSDNRGPAGLSLTPADNKAGQNLPVVHAPRRNELVTAETGIKVLKIGAPKARKSGNYGVQVGAYHDAMRARQHAVKVAARLPNPLLQGDIDVSELKRGRRTVYRSRVVGFSQRQAERACLDLQRLSQECLVVKTGIGDLAATN